MKQRTIFVILAVILIIVFSAILIENKKQHRKLEFEQNNQIENNKTPIPDVVAKFYCPNNAFIDAKFFNQESNGSNSADITLSDGRNYKLPQVISASGARYANSDESFVFWNKGDMAFTIENGKTTLNECYTKNSENQNQDKTEKLTINSKSSCEQNSGIWYVDNNTCEINSFSEEECKAKGGEFNSCASACRHDPKAQMCTLQCVLTCSFK
jgi:membrane-bound inhibitor of C-type lysozyme